MAETRARFKLATFGAAFRLIRRRVGKSRACLADMVYICTSDGKSSRSTPPLSSMSIGISFQGARANSEFRFQLLGEKKNRLTNSSYLFRCKITIVTIHTVFLQ